MGTKTKPNGSRSVDELRASEALYRAIAEDQTDLVVRFSADHRITYANPAYCRYRGMTLEQLRDTWVYADITESDRDEAQRHYLALSPDRPASTIEHRAVGADGELRWQQWTDRALFDDKGRLLAYQSTGRDITERKRAEATAQENQALLRAVIDSVPGMIMVKDRAGRYVLVNEFKAKYDGRSVDWYRGKTMAELYPEQFVREREAQEERIIATGAATGLFEYEFVEQTGEVSHWLGHMSPVCDSTGAANYLVSVAIDITARKRMEAELRESEERFRGAFESSPHGLALVAPDDRWIKINHALCEITGYSEEELLKIDFLSITHPDDLNLDLTYGRRLLAGEIPHYQMEKRYIHKDGQIVWILLSVSLVRDAAGRPLYFVAQIFDLTEHKRALTELRDSQTLLRAVIDTVPALIAVKDVAGRYVLVNWHHTAYDNRPLDWYTGKGPADLYPESYVDAARAREREVAATGVGSDLFEYEYVDHAGKSSYWLGDISPVRDTNGAISHLVSVAIDVTDRKRIDAALRESEARFRGAFESSPHGMALVAPDGRWLEINRALREITGYSAEELLKTDFQTITHPDDLDLDLAYVGRLLAGEIPSYQMEKRYIRKDGGIVWILLSVSLVRDATGRPLHFVSQIFDLTERKRAEAESHDSQVLLRAMIDAVPAAINVKDMNGRYVLVNEYQAKHNKRPIEWYPGKCPSDVYPEHYVRELRARDERVIASGQASGFSEYSFTDFDGATSAWFGNKVPLFDENGRYKYLLSASIDISELKKSEAALRESAQRYRQLVEATGVIPYSWDIDSRRFLFVGPQADKLLGYPPENWTDEEFWASHLLPADRERLIDLTRRLNDAESDHQDEYWMVAADGGTRWIRDVVTFGRDHQGRRIAFGLMFDETDSKQRDAQLAQAQKMEALGQLTGGVAHDFNNMLMVISGNLELLARRVGPEPRLHESLDLAREATRAAAELTNHLLAFARRQVLQPRNIDLAVLMSTMRELLIRTLGERIECRFVLGDGIWPVRADPGQLQSTLLNLALNARDAMPAGGRLDITVANLRSEQPETRLPAAADTGQYVKISVSDNGTGMAPDVMARAFEPFFTTKGGAKGSGLGLSMVYGFVKQSGGHISIESKPRAGTTIEILLPRAEKPEAVGAPEPAAAATRAVGVETILVVEDNARVRTTTVRMLEDLGYQVLESPDGSIALEMVRNHPEIDLLFSDIVMPGELDGPALARKARELRPSLKLLLATGFAVENPPLGSRNDLEPARISKPYDSDQLARIVRKTLDAA